MTMPEPPGQESSPTDPDKWDDDLSDFYILESSEAPLPTMLPSEAKRHEENLRLLSSFIRPLSAGEQAEREQAYQAGQGGYLTREILMRALCGEFGYP